MVSDGEFGLKRFMIGTTPGKALLPALKQGWWLGLAWKAHVLVPPAGLTIVPAARRYSRRSSRNHGISRSRFHIFPASLATAATGYQPIPLNFNAGYS